MEQKRLAPSRPEIIRTISRILLVERRFNFGNKSIPAMAKQCGISPTTWRAAEREKLLIRALTAIKICEGLDISLDYLLGLKQDRRVA